LFSRKVRRYFLDTLGKIGLTLFFLLLHLVDSLEEVGESKKICHSKDGTPTGLDHAGIRRHKARPGCWERPYMIRSLVKRDTVFPPIVAIVEDFKLLPVQGMKRMGHREYSLL
jgi:hypothetical protein